MTDEADLLAAVIVNRDEDTPRLMYADWLQEHGREIEAEFIQVQIEIERLPDKRGTVCVCDDCHGEPCMFGEFTRLTKREGELHRDFLTLPKTFHRNCGALPNWMPLERYRRGFWESWRITPGGFLDRADEIIWVPDSGRACPLTAAPLRVIELVTPPSADATNIAKMRKWKNDPFRYLGRHVLDLWRVEWPTVEFKEAWTGAMAQFWDGPNLREHE